MIFLLLINMLFVFPSVLHTVLLVEWYNWVLGQTLKWVWSLDGAHISLCWCPNLLYSSQHFFNMVLSLSISPISLSTFQGISLLGYKIRWVKWLSVADWDLNVRQSNCISYWIGNKGQHGLPPALHRLLCLDFMQRSMKVQRKLKGHISQSDNPWSYGASQPLNGDIRSIIAEDFSCSNWRLRLECLEYCTWAYKMMEFQVPPFITTAEVL